MLGQGKAVLAQGGYYAIQMSRHNMYSGWATTATGQHTATSNRNPRFLLVDKVTVPSQPPGMNMGGGVNRQGGDLI